MKKYARNQKYNKLVRDRIPEIIEADGLEAVYKHVDKEEVISMLREKLIEESLELKEAEELEDIIVELSDVLEVFKSLCEELSIPEADIEKIRKSRADKRGRFTKRIYLIETKER